MKKRLPFKIPFGRKQESKALASLDEEPERRVTVALDRGSQELVVGGAKADVDEVMAKLELVRRISFSQLPAFVDESY